jgi:hypothetical protein
MTDELKQVYAAPDGTTFDTKAEAQDYLRGPKIKEALMTVTDNNEDLSDWLVANRNVVAGAFESGFIRRITKSDHKKIDAAFAAMTASGDKAYAFLVENQESLELKYKTVKRMDEDEKMAAARVAIADATDDNNEELANWVVENREAVIEAYNAGKVKRTVSPRATEALAAYREKMAKEKAAAAGGEAAPEASAEATAAE